MAAQAKRKPLILPSRRIILPNDRRRLPRPAPWIWVPKRIADPCMSVAFVSSGVADDGSASAVSTMSHTFNAGTLTSNGALIGFLFVGSTAITSPSMTWSGTSMFLVPSTQHNASGTGTTILFGLRNPASGSNSLSASWTNAGVAALGFWSFTGVDQTADNTTFINGTSVDNGGTTTSEGPTTVTTVNGNATVYGWSAGVAFSGTQTPTADWVDPLNVTGFFYQGQHILSTTTSDSYTVAIGGTDWISGSACCIKASAAATAFSSTLPMMGVG